MTLSDICSNSFRKCAAKVFGNLRTNRCRDGVLRMSPKVKHCCLASRQSKEAVLKRELETCPSCFDLSAVRATDLNCRASQLDNFEAAGCEATGRQIVLSCVDESLAYVVVQTANGVTQPLKTNLWQRVWKSRLTVVTSLAGERGQDNYMHGPWPCEPFVASDIGPLRLTLTDYPVDMGGFISRHLVLCHQLTGECLEVTLLQLHTTPVWPPADQKLQLRSPGCNLSQQYRPALLMAAYATRLRKKSEPNGKPHEMVHVGGDARDAALYCAMSVLLARRGREIPPSHFCTFVNLACAYLANAQKLCQPDWPLQVQEAIQQLSFLLVLAGCNLLPPNSICTAPLL